MSTIDITSLATMHAIGNAPPVAVALRALAHERLWLVSPLGGRESYVAEACDADDARHYGMDHHGLGSDDVDGWPAELVTTLAAPTQEELDAVAADLDPETREAAHAMCCDDAADFMATYMEIAEGAE
jgi:hypothetical protein